MKRISLLCRLLPFSALLLIFASLQADIIILKSGDRKEGTIIAEDDVSVTLQYHLTTKLKDWVRILKTDIKEIIQQTPAQVEFEAKKLSDLPASCGHLSVGEIESIIQDKLRTFIAMHPGTPEAEKVEKIIEILNAAKNKLVPSVQCFDESTLKLVRHEIDAYRHRLKMRSMMKDLSRDMIEPKEIKALREFEALRTTRPASIQYSQAIPEALDILDVYEKRLSAMALEQPILKADRDKARAKSEQAREAIEQEERAFKTAFEVQVKAKVKWRDIAAYDLKSIHDAQVQVAKEKQELKTLNLQALQFEVESLNAALRAITLGNASEAEAIMDRLRPLKDRLINRSTFDVLDGRLKELRGH